MANKDNELKDLKYDLVRSEGISEMLELQLNLQQRLGYDFKNMPIADVANYLIYNKHCLDDELGELLDALGGNLGNAGWKTWKKQHSLFNQLRVADLTEDEVTELKYEAIDVLHFVLNIFLAIGMTGEEVHGMYVAKNAENHNRQNNGY